MKKLSTLFILIFSVILHTHASVHVHSTFITSNDGLGNNFVRHIFQDSKGFLWLSTLNGLTRYDGHSFITFRPEKGNHLSLTDHHVRQVVEDKNHFLWIRVSPEFYNCYDLEHECFVDFTGCGEYKERYSHRLEASNGDTWLWHNQNGCRRISFNNGRFQSTVFKVENENLPSDRVRQVKEDAKGNIWVCTDQGLAKITKDQCQFVDRNIAFRDVVAYNDNIYLLTAKAEIYKIAPDGNSVKPIQQLAPQVYQQNITASFLMQDNWIVMTSQSGYVFHLPEERIKPDKTFHITNGQNIWDKQGNLWIYDDKGLIRYINLTTGKVKDLHIPIGDRVTDQWCTIMQDARGWIWIATFGCGLYIYNPITDEITHFTYQVGSLNHISSNSLAFIMEDRSGGIWVTSESAGISHLTVLNNRASYIYPENKNTINNTNAIRLIQQMKNGEIWIGNRDGDLYKYDKQLKIKLQTTHFPSSIYCLMEEDDGKIWYGSRGHGLYVDGQWYTKGETPQNIPSERVFQLFRDYKERIWLGIFGGGLTLATPNKNRYVFRNFMKEYAKQQDIRYITSDKNNWMWVGTNDGLYVFHPDSLIASPNHYYHYNFDNDKLLANQIKYILRDNKDRMWVGTIGGGVSLCTAIENYAKLSFTHFTTSDGLVDNVIQSIVEDNAGKLWIATEYGISRFSPETKIFENFFFSSTTQGNVYGEGSVLKLSDGRLLLGTNHGMVIIDPTKIKSPQTVTSIALTDLKMNGISIHPNDDDSPLIRAITYTKQIELKHYQNSFVIEFSTFDYSMTNGAKYTYKLEPFDANWSTPSSLNFAAYKKLSPGTYHFQVRACNSAGLWGEQEATLEVIIKPSFWESHPAYILYFILICALLFTAFLLIKKFNYLYNRIQIEKQLTDYKLMFFTNISHEFRTPLTLIKGALEKIESIGNVSKDMIYPIQLMRKSTERMLRLINQLLEFRKIQHNRLTLMLESTEVISFLREIFLNFEEIAIDKRISYRFDSSAPQLMMYLDKGKLDKIVYNLLSNAFKYTPAGGSIAFSIRVDQENGELILSVSDTGVGISKEKQRELFSRFMQSSFSNDSVGIGLHLTHELVNAHKGRIIYQERDGGGSVFTVSLPLTTTLYDKNDFMSSEETLIQKESESEMVVTHLFTATDTPSKKKILLIEDDNDVSKFLATELEYYFEVITASDGLSGLKKAETFDGDLIICDVLMPGMNGFEVTRRLKSNFETSHIPIILLTAMSTTENQLEGTKSGADAYITKPFSPKLLLARISQLIEQRERLREKFSRTPATINPILSTTELDQKFASKLKIIMEKELANPNFSIDDFATQLSLGRTVFFRKVKGVTGYTPNEYMRIFRMKKAMELLQDGNYNVSQIAYMIGLKDPHYFSRCFKQHFGVSPSVYLQGAKEEDGEV